jgi:zinc protease
VGAPPRLGALPIRTHQFPNGLLLAVVEQRNLPIVDVEIVVRAGAALDGVHHAGRAVMVAEMLDEGTTTRTVMQIADEIDFLGAHLDITAGWDTTVLALHVLSGRLGAALDVMADVLLRPSFPADEFERKRRERLTTLLQERDEARVIANKVLARGVFGAEHPYGVPAGGTYDAVEAMKLADVREFYQSHFTPGNAFAVVVGDVSFAEIVAAFEARFAAWTGASSASIALPAPSLPERPHFLLVDKPHAAQAEIRAGHLGPSRTTPDYYPLVVLNTMLGGAFTSRLNLRLREEMAVTYGASSKFGWRVQGGLFWASAAVDTEAAAASVAVMLSEMRRLRDEPLDEQEMRRAAQYIAFGLPRAFETTEDVAAHVREQVLHGFGSDYWPRYVDRVLAVTPAQVAAAAARHLQPERAIGVIVADRGAVEASLRALNIGDVIITEIDA